MAESAQMHKGAASKLYAVHSTTFVLITVSTTHSHQSVSAIVIIEIVGIELFEKWSGAHHIEGRIGES